MRDPIPTWYFVLVVVRRGDQFLVVQERKHDQTWYLPAGRVEPGETLAEAAVRETREESGVEIELEGLLAIDHTPSLWGGSRLRVIYLARPKDDRPPKAVPDQHSLRARWVNLEELDGLPLRSDEVKVWFQWVAGGGPVHSLELIRSEGLV
ncbi:NUDIX hydrolase [Isosphaera pallida ATCC 43644]|uniref:NUDIX hydrolase n=1 Tax=Isosphaera pallida (strain ATCC 43644 / DSM 9630 / IS1B) TaxID=575540 RepID=E8R4L1_ISOPI|nr:NUDIX domain-containing protein [Isosphaera pallida]ADV60602.1 NUDIX hydrolase [Isosphaera pallida ATCC 43644]